MHLLNHVNDYKTTNKLAIFFFTQVKYEGNYSLYPKKNVHILKKKLFFSIKFYYYPPKFKEFIIH